MYFDQYEPVGNIDKAVSPHLKTWIFQNGVLVCGVTGEGTSKELQANWDSPYEGESLGSKLEKPAGVLQSGEIEIFKKVKGLTTVTTLNSIQVWKGNQPTQLNLVLDFYALEDPRKEVQLPLQRLEEMASPQVHEKCPGGRIPGEVTIKVGRRAIYAMCVIESLSITLDNEVTSDGLPIRAQATLSVGTSKMLNKSEIAERYG